MSQRASPIILIALAGLVAAGPIRAEDSPRARAGSFNLGVGTSMGHSKSSAGVGLEYRLDSRSWTPREGGRFSLIPVFGIARSSKDAVFGYAGFRSDFNVTQKWRLTPGFAVGAYSRRGDIDLGGPVEFRSSLDISRAVSDRVRIGVALSHISNARLYDRNPGVNALAFVQTF